MNNMNIIDLKDIDTVKEWRQVPKVIKRSDIDEDTNETRPFIFVDSYKVAKPIDIKYIGHNENTLLYRISIPVHDDAFDRLKVLKPTSFNQDSLNLLVKQFGSWDICPVYQDDKPIKLKELMDTKVECSKVTMTIKHSVHSAEHLFEVEKINLF